MLSKTLIRSIAAGFLLLQLLWATACDENAETKEAAIHGVVTDEAIPLSYSYSVLASGVESEKTAGYSAVNNCIAIYCEKLNQAARYPGLQLTSYLEYRKYACAGDMLAAIADGVKPVVLYSSPDLVPTGQPFVVQQCVDGLAGGSSFSSITFRPLETVDQKQEMRELAILAYYQALTRIKTLATSATRKADRDSLYAVYDSWVGTVEGSNGEDLMRQMYAAFPTIVGAIRDLKEADIEEAMQEGTYEGDNWGSQLSGRIAALKHLYQQPVNVTDGSANPVKGVYWDKCPIGMTWSGSCTGSPLAASWTAQKATCEAQGKRLPTAEEFAGLLSADGESCDWQTEAECGNCASLSACNGVIINYNTYYHYIENAAADDNYHVYSVRPQVSGSYEHFKVDTKSAGRYVRCVRSVAPPVNVLPRPNMDIPEMTTSLQAGIGLLAEAQINFPYYVRLADAGTPQYDTMLGILLDRVNESRSELGQTSYPTIDQVAADKGTTTEDIVLAADYMYTHVLLFPRKLVWSAPEAEGEKFLTGWDSDSVELPPSYFMREITPPDVSTTIPATIVVGPGGRVAGRGLAHISRVIRKDVAEILASLDTVQSTDLTADEKTVFKSYVSSGGKGPGGESTEKRIDYEITAHVSNKKIDFKIFNPTIDLSSAVTDQLALYPILDPTQYEKRFANMLCMRDGNCEGFWFYRVQFSGSAGTDGGYPQGTLNKCTYVEEPADSGVLVLQCTTPPGSVNEMVDLYWIVEHTSSADLENATWTPVGYIERDKWSKGELYLAGLVFDALETLATPDPDDLNAGKCDAMSDLHGRCIDRNWVPALENELTSDSDQYEDSYRYYLNQAKMAAAEAANARDLVLSDLIEEAQDTALIEAQLEQGEDVYLDAMREICGDATKDDAFLEAVETAHAQGKTGADFETAVFDLLAQPYGCAFNSEAPVDDPDAADVEKLGPVHCREPRNCSVDDAITLGDLGLFSESPFIGSVTAPEAALPEIAGWSVSAVSDDWLIPVEPEPAWTEDAHGGADGMMISGAAQADVCPPIPLANLVDPSTYFAAGGTTEQRIHRMKCWAKVYRTFVKGKTRAIRLPYLPEVVASFASASESGSYEDFFNTDIATGLGMTYGEYYEQLLQLSSDIDTLRSVGAAYEGHFEHALAVTDRIALLIEAAETNNELMLAEKLAQAQISAGQYEDQMNAQWQDCMEQTLGPFGGLNCDAGGCNLDGQHLKSGIISVLVGLNQYFKENRDDLCYRDDENDFRRECRNALTAMGVDGTYRNSFCETLKDNWFGAKLEQLVHQMVTDDATTSEGHATNAFIDASIHNGWYYCENHVCTYTRFYLYYNPVDGVEDRAIRGACADDQKGKNNQWRPFWWDFWDHNEADETFNKVCKKNELFWFIVDSYYMPPMAEDLLSDILSKSTEACSKFSFESEANKGETTANALAQQVEDWSSPNGKYYLAAQEAQDLAEQANMVDLVDQMVQSGVNLATSRYQLAQAIKALAVDVSELSRLEDKQITLFHNFTNGASIADASSYSSLAEWQDRFDFRKKEYQRLLARARLAAWIARRAIEFRFGIDLSRESTPTTYGDIPAEWADDIYNTAVSDCGEGDDDTSTSTVADCLTPENLIEQYVQKLEDYVDSYGSNPNTDWWFHEDNDTAVLSLRDNVSITAVNCDKTTDNLLFFTEDLDATSAEYSGVDFETAPSYWAVSGGVTFSADDEDLGMPRDVIQAHVTNEYGSFADQLEPSTADAVTSAATVGLEVKQTSSYASAVLATGSAFDEERFSTYLRSLPIQDDTMCDTASGEEYFPALGRCGVPCEISDTYPAPWGTCGAGWTGSQQKPVCMIAGYNLEDDPTSEYIYMCDWCTADRGCVFQDGQAIALTLIDRDSDAVAEAHATVYPFWSRKSVNTVDHWVTTDATGNDDDIISGIKSIQTTNLYPASEVIDTVNNWTPTYNTGVTFLPRAAYTAPHGGVSSDGVTTTTTGAQFGFTWPRGANPVGYYTVSMWVRGPTGQEIPDVLLTLKDNSSNQIGGARFTLTPEWTRVEASGLLETADTALIAQFSKEASDWTAGTAIGVWGIQVETGRGATPYIPAGKNLIARSNNMSATYWNSGTALSEFVTGVRGPDNRFVDNGGPLGVWRMTDTNGTVQYRKSPATASLAANAQITFSVWLKNANPGSSTAGLALQRSSTGLTPVAVTVDNNWRRYYVTATYTAATTWSGRIYPANPSNAAATGAVYAWGAQIETTLSTSTAPAGYQETGSSIATAVRSWGLNVGMVGAQLEPLGVLQCDAWGDVDTTVGTFTPEYYEGDQAECCADPANWDQTLCPDNHDGFYWHCMLCNYDSGTPSTCSTGVSCAASARVCQPEYFASSSEMGNPTADCGGPPQGYVRNTYLREHVSPLCSVQVASTSDLPSPGDVYGESHAETRIQLFRSQFTSVEATADSPPYHAYRFALDMDAVDAGGWGQYGIIAPGNFNHRITTVAANIVGTDVLDCSLAESPSTCAANPWVSYDLKQMGNVYIRNHHEEHNVQPFEIPAGIIRGGKAWAAEQVIGYPISGAHQTMLTQLEKVALMGRPLQGIFELRIYDVPELIWDNVEDVQLVLGVHYWSKSE